MLADGVAEGRRIFANTIKYVLMGTSSNFGNMFSAAGASAFLPFLPMLPSPDPAEQPALRHQPAGHPDRQTSTRSSCAARRTGTSASSAGSCSSSARSARSSTSSPSRVMLGVFHAGPALFRTGWFVESLATQTPGDLRDPHPAGPVLPQPAEPAAAAGGARGGGRRVRCCPPRRWPSRSASSRCRRRSSPRSPGWSSPTSR